MAQDTPPVDLGSSDQFGLEPAAWLSGDGHPRHLSYLQGTREFQLYGPLEPLYRRVALLKALRPVECSHTGMSYGDDKAGGPSGYTKGWGDCLKAVKGALGISGPNV